MTSTGERLVGEIVKPPKEFFKHMNFSSSDFEHGIWLQRKTHLSFIANSDIELKRPATVFDKEN